MILQALVVVKKNCHMFLYLLILFLFTLQLSPLKGPQCLGLLKSQSLCVLPGAGGAWRNRDAVPRGETLNRRLTTSNCSLREAVFTSHKSGPSTGVRSQNSNSTSEESMLSFWSVYLLYHYLLMPNQPMHTANRCSFLFFYLFMSVKYFQ